LGNRVALGTCCSFDGDGDSSGVALGVGDGLSSDPEGRGVGEPPFFRYGEKLGEAVGDSASADGVRFCFGIADRAGDSCLFGGEAFDFGDGVGVGDFLFAAVAFFFVCGGGVGVVKILLNLSANVGSAASFTEIASMMQVNEMKIRRRIRNSWTEKLNDSLNPDSFIMLISGP